MPILLCNDIKLYYELIGGRAARLLVWASARVIGIFKCRFCRKISSDYNLICEGHGRSGEARWPIYDSVFCGNLADLFGGSEDRISSSGWNITGWCRSFQVALDYPNMVKSLTIINSYAQFRRNPGAEAQREIRASRLELVRLIWNACNGTKSWPKPFPQQEHAALREAFIEHWAGK